MSDKTQLLNTLAPILEHLSTVDPATGADAAAALNTTFPVGGALLSACLLYTSPSPRD